MASQLITILSESKSAQISRTALAVGAIGCVLLYAIGLVVYRLWFHPLAKFPGSKLAIATGWYEFYFDAVKQGMYLYEIERMHQKYGPIIRVNPDELSIHDPDFYDKLYVGAHVRKTNNYAPFLRGMGFEDTHLQTEEHDLHKQRRKIFDPFFSRSGIRKIEPEISSLVTRFERRLREHTGQVVILDHAFFAFAGDVVQAVTCESTEYLMDDPAFSPSWHHTMRTVAQSMTLFGAVPWLLRLVTSLPESVLAAIYPTGAAFLNLDVVARKHIIHVKTETREKNSRSGAVSTGYSLFRSVFESQDLESEGDTERLVREARIMFGAGSVTTARTLDFITFYIVRDPAMRKRLADEVRLPMSKFPNEFPTLVELERVPYLAALIKEGLRLSYGVMHRLPHCYPGAPIQYREWTIPPNTPIGMSAYLNHSDPSIYPEPAEFKPERWLGDHDPRMDKCLVPFSKGSRGCLGYTLALTELYFMLATLFRPGGPVMELYQTDESDVVQWHDFGVPFPRLTSKRHPSHGEIKGQQVLSCLSNSAA